MGCGRSKELSPDKKEVIIKLKNDGLRVFEISRMLGVPEFTCRSVIKTFQKRGSLLNAKRAGRPIKMSCSGETRFL